MHQAIDDLVNIDIAGRGIGHLHAAARVLAGRPLALAAADLLAAVPRGGPVVILTGSASRAWISTSVAESDGPAGAAAVARALSLAFDAIPVIVLERALWEPVGGLFRSAGMALVTLEEARRAGSPGGRLSVAVLHDFPVDDDVARREAARLLDEVRPALLFATERPGRSTSGVYHNARGVDYGAGKARVDDLWEEARRRGVPTVAVGDGGNEIGMGNVAEAVRAHVRFGQQCICGCGSGVGAVAGADALVTAAVSNWGCYAVVASLAVLLRRADLLHTPEREAALLRRGVALGLINSPAGHVDADVDNVPFSTHLAVVELLRELAVRAIAAEGAAG